MMGTINLKFLLYFRCILISFFSHVLLVYPNYFAKSGFVFLLGQSMKLKHIKIDTDSPYLGVLSIFSGASVIQDIVPLMKNEIVNFEIVVPLRLCFFLISIIYVYFAKTSKLSNSLSFFYLFLEIWINFLIFNCLREEKYKKIQKNKENEMDDQIRSAIEN